MKPHFKFPSSHKAYNNQRIKQIIKVNFSIYLFWCVAQATCVLLSKREAFSAFQGFFSFQPSIVTQRPWTLFTYSFVYKYTDLFLVLHLLLFLYFFGSLVSNLLGEHHFITLYITSIPVIAFLLLLASHFLPFFKERIATINVSTPISTITTLIAATATYKPSKKLHLFFMPIRIKHIALFSMLVSLVDIAAYYEHEHNIDQAFMSLIAGLYGMLYGVFIRRKKPAVSQETYTSRVSVSTNIDEIWEKMSRIGYDALAPEEKERLFQQKDKP